MKRLAVLLAILPALVSTSLAQDRLRVVATTSDLRSLAKAVGGEYVIVSSLVPPGEKIATYPLKFQDSMVLKTARVVVRAGPGIDPWFDQLLARTATRLPLPDLARGAKGHVDASLAVSDVLSAYAGLAESRKRRGPEPYSWLDPKNAEAITLKILEAFKRVDPDHAKFYETNREGFLTRLNGKINEWTARLLPLRDQPMVAFQDQWEYFTRRFHLNVVDFVEQRPSGAPRRRQLAQLVKTMRERAVRFIIRQPSEPERPVNALARQTGAQVVLLAASVGALPGAEDYIGLFDANVNALVEANRKK